jgi:biotin carboxyl carrier protein
MQSRQWMPGRRAWWALGFLAVIAGIAAIGNSRPQVRAFVSATLAHWINHDHDDHPAHADHHDGDHKDDDHDHDHPEKPDVHTGENHDCKHDDHKHDDHKHDDHKHDDHKHDEVAAVKLSENAQANVGLKLGKVALQPFERTIAVPGMVVERPGRSELQVSAPLTGMVIRIWAVPGETVTPGRPLFDLRLTHEDLVEAQAEFLRTAEELDVVRREIARLERVAADGAIAGKTLLERKYEEQKLEGIFRAHRQRLLLHGLSAAQVDAIVSTRTLLSEFTVNVPAPQDESASSASEHPLQIEKLDVLKGQHVKAGDPLCVLADHARLYIQGNAFEQDAALLNRASGNNWPLTAVLETANQERTLVKNLPIAYLAGKVDPESRALLFYVELPNQMIGRRQTSDGRQFSTWQFRPGQRVDLLVPVERWENRIVLPVDAVVQDGAESYVFEQNAGHFDRRSVCVEYRDQYSVVVANDGDRKSVV